MFWYIQVNKSECRNFQFHRIVFEGKNIYNLRIAVNYTADRYLHFISIDNWYSINIESLIKIEILDAYILWMGYFEFVVGFQVIQKIQRGPQKP